MTTFTHTDQIAAANKAHGGHWFDPDTMRFFRSKTYGSVHYGRYFITSEVPWGIERRKYSIRVTDESGNVETVGEVASYATYTAASRALDRMIASGELPAFADGIVDARVAS